MNAYIFFHRVLHLVDPPIPVDTYVDTVIDVFTAGALRPAARRRRARAAGPRRARTPKRKA
jgi:hypothetical protein